jgi:hypothetical protein
VNRVSPEDETNEHASIHFIEIYGSTTLVVGASTEWAATTQTRLRRNAWAERSNEMSASVSLKAGVVGFEINISEFCQVIRDFVGASLDTEARQALKTMIDEVDKDFELVVEVVTPLYAINSVADFRQRWPEFLQDFKKQYLTQWGSLATHCGIVMDQLQRLQKAHNWKRRIPLLRDAVRRLDEMAQEWMANDAKLYESMNGFIASVNDAMMAVNKHHKTPAKALKKLEGVLQGTEKSLLKIKAYSNELKMISARLGTK